tara:strand:+ start:111 stop:449 length:339 start_codon:yes stop_codon:yes gene_type:complete
MSVLYVLGGDFWSIVNIFVFGTIYAFLIRIVTNWYYTTENDRRIQIATALVAGLYGFVSVLYVLFYDLYAGFQPLAWRFYGLSGLVVTPMLFGYMIGNLGVSPLDGEIINSS